MSIIDGDVRADRSAERGDSTGIRRKVGGSKGQRFVGGIAVVVGLALLPFLVDRGMLGQLQEVMYFAVAVLSLTLLTGRLGLVSLGQGAYLGMGAYATIVSVEAGLSWWVAILIAAVLPGVIGGIAGLPALRIKGLNLALVTLGIAIVFPQLVLKFSELTGGAAGMSASTNLPGPAILVRVVWNYWILLVVTVILFVVASALVSSRMGRAMQAIRDQEIAARILGIDVNRTKVVLYGVTAALAGVAGWMFAVVNRFVAPADFSMLLSINLLLAVIIGGTTGNIVLGPVIGAVFLVFMRDAVPALGFPSLLTPFVYGIILIIVIYALPGGASGGIRAAGAWLRRRYRSGAWATAAAEQKATQ